MLRQLPERAAEATGYGSQGGPDGDNPFGSARYSVPWQLVGDEVGVLVEDNELRVLHRGAEAALHRLQSQAVPSSKMSTIREPADLLASVGRMAT